MTTHPPRTPDPAKRRTPDRSTQSPVLLPSETEYPPVVPLHRLDGETVSKLRKKRREERQAKGDVA